ncbi:MAG: glycosyl transferase [Phycisphaerae bacterium]
MWNRLLAEVSTPALLVVNGDAGVQLDPAGLQRFTALAAESNVSILYSDYREQGPDGWVEHPTIDYQLGSLREGFDFGPVLAWGMATVRRALDRWGPLDDTRWAGLYDLRLRVSTLSLPLRIPEVLYGCQRLDSRPTGQQIFDYVDPRRRSAQEELERAATAHLERIGARVPPEFDRPVPSDETFPVEASVIIPVRNRVRTIGDAVRSALGQQAAFAFNVLVVDNHSTDGTTELLNRLAAEHRNLVHLIPARMDLGIGGCWNHAVQSSHCGRVAVQLDSDDLYEGPDTLRRIVECMDAGPYVMVVGSYRMVDMELAEIPPGLVDHREWTRENGHNNLLRVNGLGAPRAFATRILREHPLPNVSYGEDYAIGLRLSREYEIGRIFEPLYLCRRWEGNSDANLPLALRNRHDLYKDRLRTLEIRARQGIHGNGGPAEA